MRRKVEFEYAIIGGTPPKHGPNPVPTTRQEVAIRRMAGGRADEDDVRFVNELVMECRRLVCPLDNPGRSARRQSQCPGWCFLPANRSRDEQRRNAPAPREAGVAKPYALNDAAKRACGALDAGRIGAADLLELEKLAAACKADGCVADDPGATTKCGIRICPGWCSDLERAWELWWSL